MKMVMTNDFFLDYLFNQNHRNLAIKNRSYFSSGQFLAFKIFMLGDKVNLPFTMAINIFNTWNI